jgi:hypothetical protein
MNMHPLMREEMNKNLDSIRKYEETNKNKKKGKTKSIQDLLDEI